MNREIHPTAIVSPEAKLGEGVRIGAYSIVEPGVVLGEGCHIREHVILRSGTSIDSRAVLHPFVVVGEEPQHLQYKGEPTSVRIGKNVTLRECVTVNRGTTFGGHETVIGDNSFIMAYSHVAHDCKVGSGVVIANAVQLAGHVEIGDNVTLGGHSAVAQFLRVGAHCYVGGGSVLRKDLPPYLLGKGTEFEVQGINAIGLTRKGFSDDSVKRLRAAYRIFFLQNLTVARAIEKIAMDVGDMGEVREFLDFIKSSKNGFHR